MAGNISCADNNAPPINIKHSIINPISRPHSLISDFPVGSSRYDLSHTHKPYLQWLEVKESLRAASHPEARLALMAARSNKATRARPVFRLVLLVHYHCAFSLCFTCFAHRIGISLHAHPTPPKSRHIRSLLPRILRYDHLYILGVIARTGRSTRIFWKGFSRLFTTRLRRAASNSIKNVGRVGTVKIFTTPMISASEIADLMFLIDARSELNNFRLMRHLTVPMWSCQAFLEEQHTKQDESWSQGSCLRYRRPRISHR